MRTAYRPAWSVLGRFTRTSETGRYNSTRRAARLSALLYRFPSATIRSNAAFASGTGRPSGFTGARSTTTQLPSFAVGSG